jgi:hypothetical protein
MTTGRTEDNLTTRPDYRHTYPILAILLVGVTAALTVRALMVPKTFGEYGFYRAAALDDEKARPSRHVGRAACMSCHDDIGAVHAKDVHASVECETCHGPGDKHVLDNDAPMAPANTREDCLICHRHLVSRPGAFPQVDWRQHYEFVGAKDESVACVQCHSGHEPLYLDHDLRSARLHPLIQTCASCHVGRTDETLQKPAAHPTIFQCDYCHTTLAKSFAKGSHSKVRCATCHIFIKETSFSGRIVRNTNPQFCLLCHRKAPYKSTSGPPTIDWPSHIKEAAGETPDPKRACVNCHQEQIHDLYTKEGQHAM